MEQKKFEQSWQNLSGSFWVILWSFYCIAKKWNKNSSQASHFLVQLVFCFIFSKTKFWALAGNWFWLHASGLLACCLHLLLTFNFRNWFLSTPSLMVGFGRGVLATLLLWRKGSYYPCNHVVVKKRWLLWSMDGFLCFCCVWHSLCGSGFEGSACTYLLHLSKTPWVERHTLSLLVSAENGAKNTSKWIDETKMSWSRKRLAWLEFLFHFLAIQ